MPLKSHKHVKYIHMQADTYIYSVCPLTHVYIAAVNFIFESAFEEPQTHINHMPTYTHM